MSEQRKNDPFYDCLPETLKEIVTSDNIEGHNKIVVDTLVGHIKEQRGEIKRQETRIKELVNNANDVDHYLDDIVIPTCETALRAIKLSDRTLLKRQSKLEHDLEYVVNDEYWDDDSPGLPSDQILENVPTPPDWNMEEYEDWKIKYGAEFIGEEEEFDGPNNPT